MKLDIDIQRDNRGNIASIEETTRDSKPRMFMMVGLPGSGKSSIAKHIFVTRKSGLGADDDGNIYDLPSETRRPYIYSSDKIRGEICGDENSQEQNEKVFLKLHRRIKNALDNRVDVIYDATNIHKKRRIAFLNELSNIECHKVCICVMTPYEQCLMNNRNRDKEVPEHVIKRMYTSWCPPHIHEGWDNIIMLYQYGSDYLKQRYTTRNFFIDYIGADYIPQDNKHHSLTIGDHCRATKSNLLDQHDTVMTTAALLHDCGKPFTKSHFDSNGNLGDQAHYYGHQCCGAYDSLFYMDNDFKMLTEDEKLDTANIVYYHMHPFLSWKQSENAKERDINTIGFDMYCQVMELHAADEDAH